MAGIPPPPHNTTRIARSAGTPGRAFGEFIIQRVIAEGGLGIVMEAVHRTTQRRVALKTVSPDYRERFDITPEQVRQLFFHEAQVMAAIDHPHVLPLYDAGLAHPSPKVAVPYLALRLVDGGDLANRVRSEGGMEEREVLRLAYDCARGLEAIHVAGYVHCDIKPANLLLDRSGHLRISDFGVACRTGTGVQGGQIAGTPNYLAPEQISGLPMQPGVDLYSLGATMHFALTGRPPYTGESVGETLRLVRAATAPPATGTLRPGLGADCEAVVRMALHPDPGQRYVHARQMIQDCRSVLDGRSPDHALGRKARRRTLIGSLFSRADAGRGG